jgi:phosphoglycolate phosphatase-like HAD superfamily hydrolase
MDLVIFDKDGTLIGFDTMWSDWAVELGDRLSLAIGRDVRPSLALALGYDQATGTVRPGGALAATPMARLRQMAAAVLVAGGTDPIEAERAVSEAWFAPDPEVLAHPVTDLRSLLGALRAEGRRIAIATTDDRDPTVRTMAVLGVADFVDVMVCADDGLPVKPAPDMVLHVCARLGVEPARTAMIGDSPADLRMGRSAGAGRVIGVLTGVGTLDDLELLADLVLGSVEQLRIA